MRLLTRGIRAELTGHDVRHARAGRGPDERLLGVLGLEAEGDDQNILAGERRAQKGLVVVGAAADLHRCRELGLVGLGPADDGDLVDAGRGEGGDDVRADVAGAADDGDLAALLLGW